MIQKLRGNQTSICGPFSPQYIVISEDLSNVKEKIDRINNEITEIHNSYELILNSLVTKYKFVDFRDSNNITYRMENQNNEIEIGRYIIATDKNSRYKGGFILNGYNPRLYYDNFNDIILSDPFRCLFEIHADGAYISHSFQR
jgi:hypothetical protein